MSASTVAQRSRPTTRSGLRLWSLREPGMGASIIVATISSAFGVVLLAATGYLGALLRSDPALGGSQDVAQVVTVLSIILIGVAVYVAGIVTANTFATVVAGRTRQVALLRLIGASARSQRAAVANHGLVVGLLGAAAGAALGVGGATLLRGVADSQVGRPVPYQLLAPLLLLPPAAVVLTTWVAAWAGSRRVLQVTPLQAVSAAAEPSREQVAHHPLRNGLAAVGLLVGSALLVVGLIAGQLSPLGVIIAFFGGVLSFTGVTVGAALVIPPALRLVGGCFPRSVPAQLAAQNALRHPERSSRTTIGVVIAVTLVTTFTVALETTKAVIADLHDGQGSPEIDTALTSVSTVVSLLISVSALIAAVGLVNLLTLGVLQRKRELGLLRALGLSVRQVRQMVLLEATHVTITAVMLGSVLGIGYGWAGAQATFGSAHLPGEPRLGHLVAPAIPLVPMLTIVAASTVLTLVAALVPTRLATRVAPVDALGDT